MKLLVIQIAALGYNFAHDNGLEEIGGLKALKLRTVFPALTSPVQATLRTALPPAENGIEANGFLHRGLRKVLFWEQSAALVAGERIWQSHRARGGSVAMAFFQQSLGEDVDQLVSPAPIHKHGGGMITGCISRPESLYPALCQYAGSLFKLHRYWGPLASPSSSHWIARSIAGLLDSADATEIVLTYLPGLDYDLQRFGTDHPRSAKAAREVGRELALLFKTARDNGYEIVAFGDYAIENVGGGTIFPNQALRRAGLLKTRKVRKMLYPDLYHSAAFAVADHQVALLYCFDSARIGEITKLLTTLDGVDQVVVPAARQPRNEIRDERRPDLILSAKPGYWFAYPWWNYAGEAPDYASHVDIHNKPGYDPCELYFGRTPFTTSQNTTKIRGTHGRNGTGLETAVYTTLPKIPASLSELAAYLRDRLTKNQ